MGEVVNLNLASRTGISSQQSSPCDVEPMTDIQLAIKAHERASTLFHSLNLLSAHAGHVISHLTEYLRDDPRIATPEWESKFGEYHRVWISAQEALIPGVIKS